MYYRSWKRSRLFTTQAIRWAFGIYDKPVKNGKVSVVNGEVRVSEDGLPIDREDEYQYGSRNFQESLRYT